MQIDHPGLVREPPKRERVADWAYGQLRAGILRGSLQPGDHLSIPALASNLGVSRSPVREAVQQLVREGLAEEVPHRGAVVARVTPDELRRVYAVREVLEGLAAREAAAAMSEEMRSELAGVFAEHGEAVAAGDLEAHVDADMRFHRLTRLATGNEALIGFLDQIQGKIQLAMLSTSVLGGTDQALRDHERILEAIRAGDPDAAEEAARAHVARLRETLWRDDGGRGATGES